MFKFEPTHTARSLDLMEAIDELASAFEMDVSDVEHALASMCQKAADVQRLSERLDLAICSPRHQR